jgi:predicted Zn-dependent protease
MKACVATVFLLVSGACLAQAAYPEPDATAAWRGLAASYVRKAIKDQTLSRDPALNARADRIMAAIGDAVAAIDPRFDNALWKAILIDDFGHGAAAFPGEMILVDSKFLRALQVNDDELALILAHEAAHVIASHAVAKLSFMAEFLGKQKVPTARTALLEFLARDTYADAFRPTARLQEREADAIGATIFFVTGFDAARALGLFDKLADLEAREDAQTADSHDAAAQRKRAVAGVIADLQRLHSRRLNASP